MEKIPKQYIVTRLNDAWRHEEPFVEGVISAFSQIMAENAQKNILESITKAFSTPYNYDNKARFVQAFNKIIDDYKYPEVKEIIDELEKQKKKLDILQRSWEDFSIHYLQCTTNGQSAHLLYMQRAFDQIDKILNSNYE